MLLFRTEEHIDRWCRVRQFDRGAILSAEQCWRLGYEWYINRLEPDWRRHTLEEAEAIFRDIGLTGPFWNLRP